MLKTFCDFAEKIFTPVCSAAPVEVAHVLLGRHRPIAAGRAERDCCARPIEFKVAVNRSESATTAAAVLLCGLGAAPCVEDPSKFD